MTDNTHHCPICAEPFMANTPAQVALDEREETPAEEFSRLVIEYNEGEESERDEAWNLIADFACEHADTIVRALSSVYAGDDGQGALVERLQAQLRKAAGEMREEGQNGWPVTCDDAADRIEALTRENAALRADNERLERERDEAVTNFISQNKRLDDVQDDRDHYKRIADAAEAAERRLAEQGQVQGEAEICSDCKGTGEYSDWGGECPLCGGTGGAPACDTPPSPEPDAELVNDAERWRAFVSSARFKMMGTVGFDHSQYPEVSIRSDRPENEWLHFGLEVWDKHPEGDDEQGVHGRNLLLAYVEHLRRHRKQGGA